MSTARTATGLALAGMAGAALVAAATPAQAQGGQYIDMNCYSVSPNIIDTPFNGGATVYPGYTPGTFTLFSDSKSLFGYETDARIEWQNLDNGRSGVEELTYHHGLDDASGYQLYDIDSGNGRVRITITGVNRGLLTLPAPSCSGEATV